MFNRNRIKDAINQDVFQIVEASDGNTIIVGLQQSGGNLCYRPHMLCDNTISFGVVETTDILIHCKLLPSSHKDVRPRWEGNGSHNIPASTIF